MFGLPAWLLVFPVLGFLVFIHEMGHFLTAKWFGITVKEFRLWLSAAAGRHSLLAGWHHILLQLDTAWRLRAHGRRTWRGHRGRKIRPPESQRKMSFLSVVATTIPTSTASSPCPATPHKKISVGRMSSLSNSLILGNRIGGTGCSTPCRLRTASCPIPKNAPPTTS